MIQNDLFAAVGDTTRIATFSPCRRWRYKLKINWKGGLPRLVVIMLNPSTADEVRNDPTIERVCRRAAMLGFGGVIILNAFAWRDTKPENMKKSVDPVGEDNDLIIRNVLGEAKAAGWTVLVGWGNHGSFRGRDKAVIAMAEEAGVQLHCLAVNEATGQPQHPLYVAYDKPMTPWP